MGQNAFFEVSFPAPATTADLSDADAGIGADDAAVRGGRERAGEGAAGGKQGGGF